MLWGDNPGTTLEGVGEGGGGFGDGVGLPRMGPVRVMKGPRGSVSIGSATNDKDVIRLGEVAANLSTATGTESGALFTYTVEKPFSLEAHSSALVPLFQKGVDIEALAWFAEAGAPARSAVRFTNSTGQTLPAGTLAVFESGGFAGESGMDRLKPGEHRFIQFGNEPTPRSPRRSET